MSFSYCQNPTTVACKNRSPNLALTLPTISSVPIPMALSKPRLEKPEGIDLESIGYDYDTNWDSCDYVDPETLSDNVKAQDLLVLQWNLRGIRGKLYDIEDFLNDTLEQKVGIVIICETWLNNNSPPLPPIKGYTFIGKPRLDRKGGVALVSLSGKIFYSEEKQNLKLIVQY